MALPSSLTIQSVHGLKETFTVGPAGIVPVGSYGLKQTVPFGQNRAAVAKEGDNGTTLGSQNASDRT